MKNGRPNWRRSVVVGRISYELHVQFFAEREHEFLLPVHREAIYLQEEAVRDDSAVVAKGSLQLQASAIRARRRALGLPDRATGSCEIRDDEPLEGVDDDDEEE